MAQPSKRELGNDVVLCFASLHQVQGQRQPSLDLSDSVEISQAATRSLFLALPDVCVCVFAQWRKA